MHRPWALPASQTSLEGHTHLAHVLGCVVVMIIIVFYNDHLSCVTMTFIINITIGIIMSITFTIMVDIGDKHGIQMM